MVRLGTECPLAEGQLIWSMNCLHFGAPEVPSRGVLKWPMGFISCRRQKSSSVFLEHGVSLSKWGRNWWMGIYLYPESVLRCTSLSCPQKNQRHRSRQVGPPVSQQALFPSDQRPEPTLDGPVKLKSQALTGRLIREQSKTCCRKLELPISKQLGFFFFYTMHFINVW